MGVAADILRSWRHPRLVVNVRMADGVREDRALAILMGACVMIFLSQWPRLVRDAGLDPTTPLDVRLGGTLFAWLFVAPLALYLIAAISHLVAKIVGGTGSWYSARLALFWSLFVAAPLWLLNGLVDGLLGPGIAVTLTGGLALLAFVVIWVASLIETEGPGAHK
jgi:hypothetical protein